MTVEDFWLNIAGMLAPVVAFVPTAPSSRCNSLVTTPDISQFKDGDKMPEWVQAGVRNNMGAYLIVGTVALLVAFALSRSKHPAANPSTTHDVGIRRSARGRRGATDLVEGQQARRPRLAAFAMFFCVWVVVWINGWRREELATSYQRSYRILLALMVASAAVILGYKVADEWDKFHERTGWGGPPNWHQSTFWLEVIEIVLFAVFWGIQTRQRWFDEQHGGEPTS